jgi:hypothetical protein
MENTSECPGSGSLVGVDDLPFDTWDCPECGDSFQVDIVDNGMIIPLHDVHSPDPSPPQTESMPAAE